MKNNCQWQDLNSQPAVQVCEGVRMHQQRTMWALIFTRIVYAKLNIVG